MREGGCRVLLQDDDGRRRSVEEPPRVKGCQVGVHSRVRCAFDNPRAIYAKQKDTFLAKTYASSINIASIFSTELEVRSTSYFRDCYAQKHV